MSLPPLPSGPPGIASSLRVGRPKPWERKIKKTKHSFHSANNKQFSATPVECPTIQPHSASIYLEAAGEAFSLASLLPVPTSYVSHKPRLLPTLLTNLETRSSSDSTLGPANLLEQLTERETFTYIHQLIVIGLINDGDELPDDRHEEGKVCGKGHRDIMPAPGMPPSLHLHHQPRSSVSPVFWGLHYRGMTDSGIGYW